MIDLDLPVSGSINDPQFSSAALIWKAIGNLIVKAVTAPFALLASAFGGGGERAVADRVRARQSRRSTRPRAKASTRSPRRSIERPALTLTVTGESRLDSERDAWKKERLRQVVRAEKRRQAIAGGASAQRRDHGRATPSTRRC